MLKFALLGFLLNQPMTGYDLERVIRNSIEYVWPAQLSQIYRTLKQLEDEGQVSSVVEPQEGRPDRRVYSITPAGQEAFQGWLGELVTERDPIRVPFLVRFFFAGARPAAETLTQLEVLRSVYTKEAAKHETELPSFIKEAEQAYATGHRDALYWESVRRAGEIFTQAWLDWIDETAARIRAAEEEAGRARA